MTAFRFLGYVLFYSGLISIGHFAITDNPISLIAGIALLIFASILLRLTLDSRSRRRSDWWDVFDIIELPIDFIAWLFKAIKRIFD